MPRSSRLWVRALLIAAAASLGVQVQVQAQAAGNAHQGKVLAYTCLGCHGIENYHNAYPDYAVPRLVGQHRTYLVAALMEYKDGQRAYPTMHAQASSLTAQDMQDIAAYLAGTPLKSGAPPVGTLPKAAQVCAGCHGADGVSVSSMYPDLAGQHASYIERALHEYQTGYRKNPIMSTFAKTLNDSQIRQIAEYYARQRPSLHTVCRRLTFLSPPCPL